MIKTEYCDLDKILEGRLNDQVKTGKLEGEQWFRNPLGWLLVCFNNPLNFKNPNGELVVLQNNQIQISKYIKGFNQIHYGVGVGETELEIVRFELEQSGTVTLEAVDINKTFIELFGENLKDKQFEFGQDSINATLVQGLFQEYKPKLSEKILHICLGGTLGNFDDDSREFWKILSKNSKSGDRLMMGVKTDKYIDVDFNKYQTNHYYPTFVLSHIKDVNLNLIQWHKEENGYIRMSYDGIEVFRTRRFNKAKLVKEAEEYGFKIIDSANCLFEHSLVIIFEKI